MRTRFPRAIAFLLVGLLNLISGLAQESDIDAEAETPSSFSQGEISEEAQRELLLYLREHYAKKPEEWPPSQVDPSVQAQEIAPLPPPTEVDKDKATLGARLFFDPRLSGSQQISCASCHDPELAWTDGRSLPSGNHRKQLPRNTPALLNTVHQDKYFWDGRVDTLNDLVLAVIANQDEMHGDFTVVLPRIMKVAEYQEALKKLFPDQKISEKEVAAVVADFVRTIQSRGRSRFDQFVAGKTDQLTDQELLGLHLFRTKASCMNCHHGPFFTDNQFHDLGLSYYGRQLEDLGRYRVTGDPLDIGKFKTPGLRNVTKTAPYMHVGLFPLRGVMNLYNVGMPTLKPREGQENDPHFPKKSHLLKPLNLSRAEIDAVMAFLATLEEPPQRMRRQIFPPIGPDS